MELDRYWLGVPGSGRAVASRPDQSDLGSPPVHAACSSLPTRITSPMVGFVGIHGWMEQEQEQEQVYHWGSRCWGCLRRTWRYRQGRFGTSRQQSCGQRYRGSEKRRGTLVWIQMGSGEAEIRWKSSKMVGPLWKQLSNDRGASPRGCVTG